MFATMWALMFSLLTRWCVLFILRIADAILRAQCARARERAQSAREGVAKWRVSVLICVMVSAAPRAALEE